ncbi:MAG: aminoglycoside N(3)-acetyltransferase [Geminicoccales bacterium]
MMIYGRDDIAGDLRALGIAPGDGVFVHSSLRQIGHVIGGPRGLIEALVKAVGSNGLIGMPGFSRDAYDPVELLGLCVAPEHHLAIQKQVPGFDSAKSDVRQNGAVPEVFRSWPGVVRSPHPTSSVLLLGPDAEALAAIHDPRGWATGPKTPWGRLRERDAMKILLIGVGWNRCSALHAAESNAEHKRTKIRRFKNGHGPDAEWIEAPDVADDLDTLFPLVGAAWEKAGGVKAGKIGGADSKLTDYDPLLAFASHWINKHNSEGSKAAHK